MAWLEELLPNFAKSTRRDREQQLSPEEEKSIIMYASGFVIRKLHRKYVKIDTPVVGFDLVHLDENQTQVPTVDNIPGFFC